MHSGLEESGGRSVYVHVVTFNHAQTIKACLESVLAQRFENGQIILHISDNASTDGTAKLLSEFRESNAVRLDLYKDNFGFCAAHNIALKSFLDFEADYFLCLNPDLCLTENAIERLVSAIEALPEFGSACPKLLRAGPDLKPLEPAVIDAAGMYITSSLRHFDRGSGEPDEQRYNLKAEVFGGSGACLLMKREYVSDAALSQPEFFQDLCEIYPQYRSLPGDRLELFDEAFFAYREDADLSWRSQLLGWRCLYVPEALGFHVRKVLPTNRKELPSEINVLGVKNRFLLQLNNYLFAYGLSVFLSGYLFRNLAVIMGVVFRERSSFKAFGQVLKLLRRALKRRRIILSRAASNVKAVRYWFKEEYLEI